MVCCAAAHVFIFTAGSSDTGPFLLVSLSPAVLSCESILSFSTLRRILNSMPQVKLCGMSALMWIITVFLLRASCPLQAASTKQKRSSWEDPSFKCEPVTIRQCADMRYNNTFKDLSDIVGVSSQMEAEMHLLPYTPLINSNCSPHIRFFLCATFVPYCSSKVEPPIPPCRNFCEAVRSRCRDLFKHMSQPWPASLQCEGLLDKGLCIKDPHENDPITTVDTTLMSPRTAMNIINTTVATAVPLCPGKMAPVVGANKFSCAPACDIDLRFSETAKYHLEIFMMVLTVLSFLSTGLMLVTFSLTVSRFQYPERPVVWIAVCFMFVSVGYFVRIFGGRSLSCHGESGDTETRMASGGLGGNGYCTAEFLMTYFFFNAGCSWWVVLTISYILSVSGKWSCEAIVSKRFYLHALAWGIPLTLTCCVMIFHKIDADELSGICGVGNLDRDALLFFVWIPWLCYLLCGGTMGVFGMLGGLRVRRYFIEQNPKSSDTHRISVLIWKIGTLSFVFVGCLALLLACGLVELLMWDKSERVAGVHFPMVTTPVFYFRALVPLILGVLVGTWICNDKTLKVWADCMCLGSKTTEIALGREAQSPFVPLLGDQTSPFQSRGTTPFVSRQ